MPVLLRTKSTLLVSAAAIGTGAANSTAGNNPLSGRLISYSQYVFATHTS